jgi:hypothetical protein
MTKATQERRELLSIEYSGQTHTGTLIISGTRKLYITVEYRGQRVSDGRVWGTHTEEQHNMRVIAQTLLVRLVGDTK